MITKEELTRLEELKYDTVGLPDEVFEKFCQVKIVMEPVRGFEYSTSMSLNRFDALQKRADSVDKLTAALREKDAIIEKQDAVLEWYANEEHWVPDETGGCQVFKMEIPSGVTARQCREEVKGMIE